MANQNIRSPDVWYREPWPWLLMSGPALVVVAAIYTAWLAISGADGLVADDYYTQGIAINRVLAREVTAARLGLHASAGISGNALVVDIQSRPGATALPNTLQLKLVHPTRAGLDQSVILSSTGGGRYETRILPPAPGDWNIVIENPGWRLTGHWQAPFSDRAELTPGG